MKCLERAFDLAAGSIVTPCDACGGPRFDLPTLIELRPGEQIGTCDSCHGATLPDGRSARRWTSEGVNNAPLITYAEEE